MQDLPCSGVVREVRTLLWCKWVTQPLVESGIDDCPEGSQNPMLSPVQANELHFFILKPWRSTSNYNQLLMTSSFTVGLPRANGIFRWLEEISGIDTPFAAFLGHRLS